MVKFQVLSSSSSSLLLLFLLLLLLLLLSSYLIWIIIIIIIIMIIITIILLIITIVLALYVNDGESILCQTNAIMRYLGKLTGLYPTCPIKAALVDSLMDFEADLFAGLSVSRYSERFGYSVLTPENIAVIRKELNDTVLPVQLANLEKLLQKSQTGYAAGTDEPSIADFVLVPRLEWY